MIKIDNISIKYGDKIILNKVSYCFKESGLYCLSGESGVGKTTLLNIISNRISGYTGEVKIEGGLFFFSYSDYLIDDFSVKELIDELIGA